MSKWDAIPAEWRNNIDNALHSVMNENRGQALAYHDLTAALSRMSPPNFRDGLVAAWKAHNAFFSSLTPLATVLPNAPVLSRKDKDLVEQVLHDSEIVDTITLAYSLAIKPHLDIWSKHFDVTVQPDRMFHFTYFADHYRLEHNELIAKYHAGSKELFMQREKYIRDAPFERCIALEKRLFHDTHYTLRVDRHPFINAMVDIANVDNYDEYTYLYKLEGIEGFALRHYIRKTTAADVPLCQYSAHTTIAALRKIRATGENRLPAPNKEYIDALQQSTNLLAKTNRSVVQA